MLWTWWNCCILFLTFPSHDYILGQCFTVFQKWHIIMTKNVKYHLEQIISCNCSEYQPDFRPCTRVQPCLGQLLDLRLQPSGLCFYSLGSDREGTFMADEAVAQTKGSTWALMKQNNQIRFDCFWYYDCFADICCFFDLISKWFSCIFSLTLGELYCAVKNSETFQSHEIFLHVGL